MTATKNKAHRRRRRCSRKRVGWCRGFRDVLVCVCVGASRRVRGRPMAGYRVVRVVRAKVDRRRRQVVELVVRMCGGPRERNDGFNGPRLTLTNRDEFAHPRLHLGVCAGSQTVPVDAYYATLLRRKKGGN